MPAGPAKCRGEFREPGLSISTANFRIKYCPATCEPSWSRHGSSTIPSKHSTPQDLHSP